jgi:hypothetical protein
LDDVIVSPENSGLTTGVALVVSAEASVRIRMSPTWICVDLPIRAVLTTGIGEPDVFWYANDRPLIVSLLRAG